MQHLHRTTFLFHLLGMVLVTAIDFDPFPGDILTPYKETQLLTRRKRSHRFVRDCQPVIYGNVTHEEFPSSRKTDGAFIKTRSFMKGVQSVHGGTRYASGHITWLENPLRTFSILEPKSPGKGCLNKWFGDRDTVQNSANQRNCSVAINAGYFRTSTGACLGNIFSDGRFVRDAGGVQNANFGLKSDGTIIVGYLPEEMIHETRNPFSQLVSGVFWLLRNGSVYINESKKVECPELEETGTLDLFASVLSGRTAIGHDNKGRVMFIQVDGKTHHAGLNLYDFASLLQDFGVVNAINLDGGGSSTYIVDGQVVNYPSDSCGDFNCPRKVSTIACGHEPDCDPEDCQGNGHCVMGQCICKTAWRGQSCEELACLKDGCSDHGNCTEAGCDCAPGWHGASCSDVCPDGVFGKNCQDKCQCANGAACNKIDGRCQCHPGWTGPLCEQVCLPGSYGEGCQHICDCANSYFCHPATGSCTNVSTFFHSSLNKHWLQCMKHRNKTRNDQGAKLEETSQIILKDQSMLLLWFVAAVSFCAVSVVANLLLLYLQCHVSSTRHSAPRYKDGTDASHSLLHSSAQEEL